MSEGTIDGCVALVTGASSGIGRAIADLFFAKGAVVTVCARDKNRLRQLEEETAGKVTAIAADATVEEDRARVVSQVLERDGRIDVLVNNVGGSTPARLLESTHDEWVVALELNLLTAVDFTRLIGPGMIERGYGRIINIASHVALEPDPLFSPYAAAKAALLNFSQSAAQAMADKGITVNCVLPGLVRSASTQRLAQVSAAARSLTVDEVMVRMLRKHPIPVGRIGETADIAEAVLFFASRTAAWVTGSALVVDGGAHRSALA